MYVKEISQENITGILGTFQILMHTTGIFLMYVMGAYLDYTTVIIIVTGLSVLTLIALTKAPESPAFLVKQDRIEVSDKECTFCLKWLLESVDDCQIMKHDRKKVIVNQKNVSYGFIFTTRDSYHHS